MPEFSKWGFEYMACYFNHVFCPLRLTIYKLSTGSHYTSDDKVSVTFNEFDRLKNLMETLSLNYAG